MKNFNGENSRGGFGFKRGGGGRDFKKQGGGKDFGGKPRFGNNREERGGYRGGSDRGERTAEMFSAVCSTCGKDCEVPFRPSNDKPVYCSACFGKKGQDDSRGFNRKEHNDDRGRKNSKSDYAPSHDGGKHNASFERGPAALDTKVLMDKIAFLETKINTVLELLSTHVTPSVKSTVVEKTKRVDSAVVVEAKAVAPAKKATKKVAKKATKKVVKKTTKTAAKKTAKKSK